MPKQEWDERSAIWGGATAGFFIGLVIGLIRGNLSGTIFKAIVIGGILGLFDEFLGKLGDYLRKGR